MFQAAFIYKQSFYFKSLLFPNPQTNLSAKYWHQIIKQWNLYSETFYSGPKYTSIFTAFPLILPGLDLVILFCVVGVKDQRGERAATVTDKQTSHVLGRSRARQSSHAELCVRCYRKWSFSPGNVDPRTLRFHLASSVIVCMSLTRRMQRRCYVTDLDAG